jgi:S-adenosylmethionine decarboxylase
MILKDFALDNYLFDVSEKDLSPAESETIREKLQTEMAEIFYGRNYSKSIY